MRCDAILTNGKFEGLVHISDPSGKFSIVATDQRGSLQRVVNPEDPSSVSVEEMRRFKKAFIRDLAGRRSRGRASGILIDPEYSHERGFVKACDIRGDVGLLMGIEADGYGEGGEFAPRARIFGRLGIEEGVNRIKMRGAAAVKMLVFYNPNGPTRKHQEAVIRGVGRACERFDIPFLLEPISHSLSGGPNKTGDPREFSEVRPRIIVETVKELTRPEYCVDVLKAEFPLDVAYAEELGQDAREACRELDESCPIPWIILSAGVDFDDFVKNLRCATENGASGFLCGRAIWKEAVHIQDLDGFLLETGVNRLNQLVEIVEDGALPWYRKYVDSMGGIEVIRGE